MTHLVNFTPAKLTHRVHMQQIRPGNYIAIEQDGKFYHCLVLSKVLFFGAQWARFFCPAATEITPYAAISTAHHFDALVDFIEHLRAGSIHKISTLPDGSYKPVTEFAKAKIVFPDQEPYWSIYNSTLAVVDEKETLSDEEMAFPIGKGMSSEMALSLVDVNWSPVEYDHPVLGGLFS